MEIQMSDKTTEQVLRFARQHCQQQGLRLTVKRSNVLQVMLDEAKPLSAYDIMAAYQVHFNHIGKD
jgi:Fur family zinc uptake transcriptional regulator